jgi:hypothetical protein
MAIRDMAHLFGVAYTDSTGDLRISVPDEVKFPHHTAWVWMRDRSTVCMSPNKPAGHGEALELTLFRTGTLPGCRSIILPGPIHGIGEPFRMQSTTYRMDGQGFAIFLPSEADRLPVRKRRRAPIAIHAPEPAVPRIEPVHFPLATATHEVLVDVDGDTLEFDVPAAELAILMAHWRRAGYGAD